MLKINTIAGFGGKRILPWQISNPIQEAVLSVSSQTSIPSDLAFSADGTKMYVCGDFTTNVWQYTLPIPFRLMGASYASKTFTASEGGGSSVRGIFVRADGAKLFLGIGKSVYRYSLTSGDINTASYDTNTFDCSTQMTTDNVQALYFKPDGTKMYVCNDSNVWQYSLGTAWDLSTASYDSVTNSAPGSYMRGLTFSPDGLRFFWARDSSGSGDEKVYRYDLSSAWSLASWTLVTSEQYNFYSDESGLNGVAFSSDGTRVFIVGTANDAVRQYRCN